MIKEYRVPQKEWNTLSFFLPVGNKHEKQISKLFKIKWDLRLCKWNNRTINFQKVAPFKFLHGR